MGGAQKKVNLDRTALRTYLAEHKIRANKLSLEMGWANNYLTECLRDNNPKPMNLASYKYLCTMLKVPEDTFILKNDTNREQEKVATTQPTVINSGLSTGQFNALLQAIQSLTDAITTGFASIASSENSSAVIQGKIYGEVSELTKALGVNKPVSSTEQKPSVTPIVHVKPSYANSVGGKK